MKRITIIGGGASGTLLAANLLRCKPSETVEVNMVEKRSAIGRGVAYSTSDDIHLLNVPAGRMGAFAENVGYFHEWLIANGYEFDANSFVPRNIFGEYLRDTLHRSETNKEKNIRLNLFEDDAVDVIQDGGKLQVVLASGEHIYSERLVLAFGNFLPPQPSVRDLGFTAHSKYFRSPWQENVFTSIDRDDTVLIIGTGLSMVDVVLKLDRLEHRGRIIAISTRGLLPAVHKLGFTYKSFADELRPMARVTDMLKAVRRHIKKAEENGSDWRGVIDSLRPVTQELWLNLPVAEKRYFMQHLSRYWNVARHRMPAEAAAVLDRLCNSGKLEVLKGRLLSITSGVQFDIEYRSQGEIKRIEANAIINCIGSESNFERLDSALVRSLYTRGLIRNDALSFGIDALPNGRVVGQNGEASDMIHTLGTALKGTLWETTAIPEIRTQARDLAKILLAD